MAMASPTPMPSSHFPSMARRPASRNAYKGPPTRPVISRRESDGAAGHARVYSLNDSSDDEIQLPMKLSALTNAILNDAAPVGISPKIQQRVSPEPEVYGQRHHARTGSTNMVLDRVEGTGGRVHSPYPRRVVRLSGTPSTLRRSKSLVAPVSAEKKEMHQPHPVRAESPLDLSTPAPLPRTVKLSAGPRNGSSGRMGHLSGSREAEVEAQEYPSTVARTALATSQGSVSRYAPTTTGRTRYGEETGLQSSMRAKNVGRVGGKYMSGPARRGRRRISDEEQSPVDGENAPSSQEPESQESQAPESQSQEKMSIQDAEAEYDAFYRESFRSGSPVYKSGSPPAHLKEILDSVMGSKSPPPPTFSSSQRRSAESKPASQPVHPIFRVPAPRPDLPSAHDQENEAPSTFKRNSKAPLILMDKMEKVPVRPESMDIDELLRTATPSDRRPLAPRGQNTPRRPAPPPPKMSILEAATSTAGAATASNAGKKNRLRVNGKHFTRLDCIGRGGSSRVYRVMADNSAFFALKRVSLDDADETAVRGFKGEIDLLRKLEGVERVIRLYDYELNEAKGTLSVLMEMGELDMNKILDTRLKSDNSKLDPSFVRHYWKEMLECLQAIHAHDIVHSDLKPHNFVLVKGQLKLIDFGIANAIQTDETVNVHRETQIGTPNYMSPESLMDSNAKPDSRGRIANEPKLMKLGKPSDIWSLGCILYQMTYGRAPFAHIQNQMQRCQAIINWNYAIEYPSTGVGGVPVPASLIKTLKKCLSRDQHLRPSATELLKDSDPFLNPAEMGADEAALPITEELLGRILLNVASKCRDRMPTEAELLSAWPKGYFERLRKNLREGKPL